MARSNRCPRCGEPIEPVVHRLAGRDIMVAACRCGWRGTKTKRRVVRS